MTRERAPLPGLYGNVGQIYHSGLTVQFSYLPRAACRLYPKPSRGGWSRWWRRSRARYRGMGMDAGSGAEAADRGSANTLPSSLAPFLSHSVRLIPLSIHHRSYPSSPGIPTSLYSPFSSLSLCLSLSSFVFFPRIKENDSTR